jgi:AraC family transcriptional regulator
MTPAETVHSRVLSDSEILSIVPTLPYRTSWELYWPGVEVHRYSLPAGSSGDHSFPRLAIFLPQSPEPYNVERCETGKITRKEIQSDSVSITPPGLVVSGSRDKPGELTVIFLDLHIVSDISLAITGLEEPEIQRQLGIHDPVVRALGESLDAELFASRPSPRAYIECLARSLGAHIVSKYAKREYPDGDSSAMNGTQLRRSIAFMKEHLDTEVTLEALASVAAMSKFHFAKSFKHAMGVAPHQYLVRLRIEQARKILAHDTLSVEQIANSVGYADTAHFAEVFRRLTGLSPSQYRRRK